MNFSLNDEQMALKQSAQRFLRDRANSAVVRSSMKTESGFDAGVWSAITQELGWTAVSIPETYGGFGLSFVELVVLMEEMGQALLCSPFFSSICLSANTLLTAGTEEQKNRFLPAIAEGRQTAALAYLEQNGGENPLAVQTTAELDGDHYVLSGEKAFVIDGHTADWLIVSAQTSGSTGISLFVIPANAAGLKRTRTPTMDETRKQATLQLKSVRVPVTDRLGSDDDATPALLRTLDLASVALAAEQMGGAQRCLDMAVSYAKERVQFGRTIGSFQAIKHKCADMMLLVESARSACYYGGWVASNKPELLHQTASMVRAYCSDAFFTCASESLQIHGGIGFTWEHDVHLYFKRAQGMTSILGSAATHRERIASMLFGEG